MTKIQKYILCAAIAIFLGIGIGVIASSFDAKATYIGSMMASEVTPDSTHEFVTDSQIAQWNNGMVKTYVSGVLQASSTTMYYSSATTGTGGTLSFNVTNTGTATGTAVFSHVYVPSIKVVPSVSTTAYYGISVPTVSADRKTISFTVVQTNSVLLGLLSFSSSPSGLTFNLSVQGD